MVGADATAHKADLVADMNSARQSILTRLSAPFELHAVIQEAALLHEFDGKPHIMRDQHRRLLELSARPNVTVQIVPLRRSVHIGSHGDFHVLMYGGQEATVYNELLTSSFMTNEVHEVARYQATMRALSEDVALPVEDSTKLLSELSA